MTVRDLEHHARELLSALGYRQSDAAVTGVVAWQHADSLLAEELAGSYDKGALNGIEAIAGALRSTDGYGPILTALAADPGDAHAIAAAVDASPWETESPVVDALAALGSDYKPAEPEVPADVPDPVDVPEGPSVALTWPSENPYDPHVRTAQEQLAARGWQIVPDGWFGPNMSAALQRFTRSVNDDRREAGQDEFLREDGVLDAEVWAALYTAPVTELERTYKSAPAATP